MNEEEKDILVRAQEIIGKNDGYGYGWSGLYEAINTIEDMSNEIKTLRNLVEECKAAGSYDAAMHKRDKKELENWKKKFKELDKSYDELRESYGELDNKYIEMCSAYSGIPLQYIPAPSSKITGDLAINTPEIYFMASDAGASMAVEAAEEKLKRQKGEQNA
jgi:hypothetical protein